MSTKLLISVYSDIICPWCYIGATRLSRAIKDLSAEESVTIVYKSYQLYPDPDALRRQSKLATGRIKVMGKEIKKIAAEEGLSIRSNKSNLFPNTFDAHRLLAMSGDLQRELATKLFEAYFREGIDVENVSALADIGEKSGIDPNTLKRFADNPSFGENEVNQNFIEAKRLNITAVPSFQLEESHVITGAIEHTRWIHFLKKRI